MPSDTYNNLQTHHRVFIAKNKLCLDRYPSLQLGRGWVNFCLFREVIYERVYALLSFVEYRNVLQYFASNFLFVRNKHTEKIIFVKRIFWLWTISFSALQLFFLYTSKLNYSQVSTLEFCFFFNWLFVVALTARSYRDCHLLGMRNFRSQISLLGYFTSEIVHFVNNGFQVL